MVYRFRHFWLFILVVCAWFLPGCADNSEPPATDVAAVDTTVDMVLDSTTVSDVADSDWVGDGTTVDTVDPPDDGPIDSVTPDVVDTVEPTDIADGSGPLDTVDGGDTGPVPDCTDDDKCTVSYLNKDTNRCVFAPVTCNDGSPCTEDACDPKAGCSFVYTPKEGCCTAAAECDDDNSCTTDTCTKFTCQHLLIPQSNCCKEDYQCVDLNNCTTDLCIAGNCTNTLVPPPECCVSHADCQTGDPCTFSQCKDGTCKSTTVCCFDNADCDSQNPCATDVCQDGWCTQVPSGQENCCSPGQAVLSVDFEDMSPAGFEWTNTHPSVGWQVLKGPKGDTEGALYYGSAVTWNYETGGASNGTARSPAFVVPAGVRTHLTLRAYLGVEAGQFYDRLYILVEREDTSTVIIWEKTAVTLFTWTDITVALHPFAGQTIRLLFRFDTINSKSNTYDGVYLDDIVVQSSCEPLVCRAETDCDDGIITTLDHCVDGTCAYKIHPQYCGEDNTLCNDLNECTYDVCSSALCAYPPKPACCLTNEECNDDDPCTQDVCFVLLAGFCDYTAKKDCCMDDSNCDDDNPCTADWCPAVGGPCQHDPIPDCCNINAECVDEQPCTLDQCVQNGCKFTNLCCNTDLDCDDGDDACTTEVCGNGMCQYQYVDGDGCCKITVYEQSFEADLALVGFVIQDDVPKDDTVTWQLSNSLAYDGVRSLYYGDLAAGNYETGNLRNHAEIVTTPIMLPGSGYVELAFQVYLANEFSVGGYPNADWDRLTVTVLPPSGDPVLVWDSAWLWPVWWVNGPSGEPAGAVWTLVDGIELTQWLDQPIQLEFRFDTKDGFHNDYAGAGIDMLTLTVTCPPAMERGDDSTK